MVENQWYQHRFWYLDHVVLTKILKKQISGAAHADDTSYTFKTRLNTISTKNDRSIVKTMVDLFSSFAKTGKPQITFSEWSEVAKDKDTPLRYMKIETPEEIGMESEPLLDTAEFWDSLPIKENEKLFVKNKDEL